MVVRLLVLVVTLAILAAPVAADAQPAGRVWRIGFLGGAVPQFIQAFQEGLRELGYVDGQNIAIQYRRWTRSDELPLLAAELVRLKVDVLVAATTEPAVAAKRATTTIPIVMVNVGDPVESGLVASLARPGRNVTGLSRGTLDLVGKNLELLAEAVPRAVRVAVLSNPANPLHPALVGSAKQAAALLRLQLKIAEAAAPMDMEGAFSALARVRCAAALASVRVDTYDRGGSGENGP